MPEFVGFQTMGILVPYGITFDAVGVCGTKAADSTRMASL